MSATEREFSTAEFIGTRAESTPCERQPYMLQAAKANRSPKDENQRKNFCKGRRSRPSVLK